jgi:hypothetical protein
MTPSLVVTGRVVNCAPAPITDLALTRTTRDSQPPFQTIMVDGVLRPAGAAADGDAVIFC